MCERGRALRAPGRAVSSALLRTEHGRDGSLHRIEGARLLPNKRGDHEPQRADDAAEQARSEADGREGAEAAEDEEEEAEVSLVHHQTVDVVQASGPPRKDAAGDEEERQWRRHDVLGPVQRHDTQVALPRKRERQNEKQNNRDDAPDVDGGEIAVCDCGTRLAAVQPLSTACHGVHPSRRKLRTVQDGLNNGCDDSCDAHEAEADLVLQGVVLTEVEFEPEENAAKHFGRVRAGSRRSPAQRGWSAGELNQAALGGASLWVFEVVKQERVLVVVVRGRLGSSSGRHRDRVGVAGCPRSP